jgi:hypothetical protein
MLDIRISSRNPIIYKGSFNGSPEKLLSLMRDNGFICTPTTTGKISLVSYQRKSDDWNRIGGNFYFHQDGSHLPSKPEFVALLCKNKGTTRTVTSITDGRKIYQHSAKIVGKKFLHSLMAVYLDTQKKCTQDHLLKKMSMASAI